MNDERNIDDLFRSSFEDFEVAPPVTVKKAIDREIGKRTSRGMWWLFLAMLLVGSGVFAYFHFTSAPAKTPLASTTVSDPSASRPGSNRSSGTTNAPSGSSTHASEHASGANNTGKAADKRLAAQNTTVSGRKSVAAAKWSGQKAHSATKAGNKRNKPRSGSATVSSSDESVRRARSAWTAARSAEAGSPVRKAKTSGTESGNGTVSGKQQTASESRERVVPGGNASKGVLVQSGKEFDAGNGEGDQAPPAKDPNKAVDPASVNPPSDSLPKQPESPVANTMEANDSSTEPGTKRPKDDDKDAPEDPWRASVYFGPQFVRNTVSGLDPETQQFTEKPGSVMLAAEINRSLFNGFGLSTGVQLGTKRRESFTESDTETTVTYIITDSVPVLDSTQTDTIDWFYEYGDSIVQTFETSYTLLNSVRTFTLPLYVTREFRFNENWGLLASAGAQFNFYRVTLGSVSDTNAVKTTANDFGTTLIGRAHLTHQWNQLQFSAGFSGGYDLKLPVMYEGIDRRRYFITPQIAVHFIF
jgi:hypothetical protein